MYKQISNWDYRWYFEGSGSMNKEISIGNFSKRADGNYEVGFWHKKYGNGTILLNDKFEPIGKVIKPAPLAEKLKIEGTFPGLEIRTRASEGQQKESYIRYILKWETINRNHDKAREKPWPAPSQLYLYKIENY